MTTYYVDPVNGLDANNGLGPDASHATNKPWKTVGKALNTGSVISNATANTLWCAPGVYYSEALVPIAAIASTANPLAIRGDPTNSQGFKTAGGVRVATGIVWVTTRTAAEGLDADPAAGTTLIAGSTNGTNGLQIYDCVLEAWGANAVGLSPSANADWTFERVRFSNGIGGYNIGTPTAGRNLTCRACIFLCDIALNFNNGTAAATANADLNIKFESCLFLARATGGFSFGTSAGNKAGGVRYKGCTFICPSAAGQSAILCTALVVSTVTPVRIEGCLFFGGQAVQGGTLGQVIDDGYNRYLVSTDSTNFTVAGTSAYRAAANIVLPDLLPWGLALNINDVFGWSRDAVATQMATAWAAGGITDYRNRTARPWGGGASIGYLESSPVSQDTAGAVTGGGVNSLKITGAGEMSLFVAVDAVPTTLTIYTESTTYGGASYPQFVMEASPVAGVAAQTATATDATEQQLTLTFTPTASGVVEIRLVSRSTSISSATFFDRLVRA